MSLHYDTEADMDDAVYELSYQLLQAGWFLRTYSLSQAKTKAQRVEAKRVLAFIDCITRDVLIDPDQPTAIAAAIHNDQATEEQMDALRDIIDEFKLYVTAEKEVCKSLFPSGTVACESAYRRVAVYGKYWSQNLDLYRGASPLRECSTILSEDVFVASLSDDLMLAASPSKIHRYIEDRDLMLQLFPPPLGENKAIVYDWCSRPTHPLFSHEIYWISHDTIAVKRVRDIVAAIVRGFGLTDTGDQIPKFEEDPLIEARNEAWRWMSTSVCFISRLTLIVDTLVSLNRMRLLTNLLLALVRIPGWVDFFGDEMPDIVAKLKPGEQLQVTNAIDAAKRSPEPTLPD
jgi:hypothetical protein